MTQHLITTASKATSTLEGISKLSLDPAVTDTPIALGANDPRIWYQYCGVETLPTLTDNGGGSVTIGDNGVYLVHSSQTTTGNVTRHALSGLTQTLTDGVINYIYVDYNGGSPAVKWTTTRTDISDTMLVTASPIYTIYRDGSDLHYLNWDNAAVGLPEKQLLRTINIHRFERESGLALTDDGSQTFKVSQGYIWYGVNRQSLDEMTSDADRVTEYIWNGSSWDESTVTTFENTYYQGASGKVELTANRYAVTWVYRGVETNKHAFTLLGTGDYKLAEAQAAQPPTSLPSIVSAIGILVGKIITLKGDTAATSVESAFATTFTPSGAFNHNDLTSIQGGTGGEYYHLTVDDYNRTVNDPTITKEPTGFLEPENVVVTYDSSARTITLTGTVTAYYRGLVVSALTSGWVSSAHTNTTGHIYFLYYDGSSFAWSTDAFPGFDKLLIAWVTYGASDKIGLRECHGMMPWQCHLADHWSKGTYRLSGGTVAGITLSSTTAAERRPSVSDCLIYDEDLPTTNTALADNGPYTQFYLSSTGVETFAVDAADIVPLSAANPYYNSFSSPTWGQTLMPSNSVATVWLMAVPASADAASQKYRFLWVQPQWITQATNSSAGALATARAAEAARTPGELNLGTLTSVIPELILIQRLTIQYTGGNWTIEASSALTGTRYQQSGTPSGNFLQGVTASSPLTGTGTVADPLAIPLATDSVSGYLSAADHTSFNLKVSGTGATGQVAYFDSVKGVTSSANFTYNSTTGMIIGNTTASTSTSTGALRVAGGIGVTGAINSGSYIKAASTFMASSGTTGAIVSLGGIGVSVAPTDTTGDIAAYWTNLTATPSTTSGATVTGIKMFVQNAAGATSSTGYMYGAYISARSVLTTGATASNVYGSQMIADNNGSGAISTARAIQATVANYSTGTITTAVGINITTVNSGGGTVTNLRGINIDDVSAGTNNYAIYTNAGAVRFGGATTIADTTASTSTTTGSLIVSGGAGIAGALYVGGLITGQTGLNIQANATASSFPPETGGLIYAVQADGTECNAYLEAYGNRTKFAGRRYNGTKASSTGIVDGDILSQFAAQGYDTSAISTNAAAMNMTGDGTWSASSHPTRMLFNTCPAASTTIQESMRITNAGAVWFPRIGTTATAGNAFLDSGASNNLLRSTSSIRYKKEVETVDPAHSSLLYQMRPVWFRSLCDADRKDWSFYGFIAEEMALVAPQLVHWSYLPEDYTDVPGKEEGEPSTKVLKPGAQLVPDGVQYDRLTALLVAELQRLEARVKDLEAKIAYGKN